MPAHAAAVHGPDFTMNFVTLVRLADNRIRVRLVRPCRLTPGNKGSCDQNAAKEQRSRKVSFALI